jgi:putative phosphoesterase
MPGKDRTIVGVISDTHALLRPEALDALQGSDLIIHVGDVGDPQILEELRTIAPTYAVRGNIDTRPWAEALPLREVVEVGDVRLYVLHILSDLDLDPVTAGFAAVIFGHTHRPHAETRNNVLYLNPGSAGPHRFTLPITVARLEIAGSRISHEIIELHV